MSFTKSWLGSSRKGYVDEDELLTCRSYLTSFLCGVTTEYPLENLDIPGLAKMCPEPQKYILHFHARLSSVEKVKSQMGTTEMLCC
ncbi:hypothetical protein M0R45_005786 [Rubus argutus]|uniref:Uncharacterized protein n=1 Tax=Rubus argutus TaxID=59490 RepID=A0AAW1YNR6_RUBAR